MVTLSAVTGGGGTGGFLGSAGGFGGTTGTALMPAWLKIRAWGSSTSVPLNVTVTVLPALSPLGVMVDSRGLGRRDSGSWAGDRPVSTVPPSKASRATRH